MEPTAISPLRSTWNATNAHVHHKTTDDLLRVGPPQGGAGPGPGMYALALIFVFALGAAVEWFHYSGIIKPGTNKVAAGFFQTGMHAARSGLSYTVILAVISFNAVVFLAAVGGHAAGFLVFGSRAFRKPGGLGLLDLPKR